MLVLEVVTSSPHETEELGELLGSLLPAGTLVALQGSLGSGKTCFTRGIVQSVAPQSAHLVASPTFAIMNSYAGVSTVHHFDFYRLSGDNDIAELGLDDYFHGDGVCVIEWSERLSELLPLDHITVRFEFAGNDGRQITLSACGSLSLNILGNLANLSRFKCRMPHAAKKSLT